MSVASALLAWTDRLHVGVGVFPVPLRNVALAAMETAALQRMFPGRFTVGVGHGVQDWMGQVGARAGSPVTLLSEYLPALRALLRGEPVTTAGRYVTLDDVTLGLPPLAPVPVYCAAAGPRTLAVSGRHADGTILDSGTTPDRTRAAREAIDRARAEAGRTDPHPIVVYLQAVTGPDAAARLAAMNQEGANQEGPNQESTASVAGDAHAVADAVRFWAGLGADRVILHPASDDKDPLAFIRFTAEQVQPLLS
jgi:alkanesulfonate monooxygenase SsuD/methylene tetrahydromethanopterin reductase-like flavin-dependent oxidoreductase (luciferase family)